MWIVIAITAYFLLALVAVIDKYLLSGPLPSPKPYAFCVGVVGGGVAVLLAVFGFVVIPEVPIILLGLFAGIMRTLFLFALFRALFLFEASRVVPALGAILPLFLLLLVFFFVRDATIFELSNFAAFFLLVAGAFGVSVAKNSRMTAQSVAAVSLAAFLGAASFFFSKFAYDAQPFLSGLAWLLIGAFLASLVFLASREVRREVGRIFSKPKHAAQVSGKKFPLWIFLGNQVAGGGAAFLQNLAIALVPLGLLSFVSAMSGIEYVFLFAFTMFLSRRFPSILTEEISGSSILQKTISILLIALGLALLAL